MKKKYKPIEVKTKAPIFSELSDAITEKCNYAVAEAFQQYGETLENESKKHGLNLNVSFSKIDLKIVIQPLQLPLISTHYDKNKNVVHCYKQIEFFEFYIGEIEKTKSLYQLVDKVDNSKGAGKGMGNLWEMIEFIDKLTSLSVTKNKKI